MSKLEKLINLLKSDFAEPYKTLRSFMHDEYTELILESEDRELDNSFFDRIRKAVLEVEPCEDCSIDAFLKEAIDEI